MKHKKIIVLISFCIVILVTSGVYKYFYSNPYITKLDRVILATDANPNYIQFWPAVAKAWTELIGVRPTLALIASQDVPIDESLGDVIRFEPIPNIPTSLQAQVIRLLLPAYFENDVCIISDIDMIPLNKDYFLKGIEGIPHDHFVVYRDIAYPAACKRYAICYNAAKGHVYKEIFNINKLSDIPSIIKLWHSYELGWDTDELLLYKYLKKWPKFNTHCTLLGQRGDIKPQQRVDRIRWGCNKQLLASNYYIDMHCPRPYQDYKKDIDLILQYAYHYYEKGNNSYAA